MRILLVDDDNIFILICKKLIEKCGISFELSAAKNGKEAMEYLNAIENGSDSWPSVILLDLNMPVMNGWEFLNHYKQFIDKSGVHIPIYIVSSTIHKADIESSTCFPFVRGFISKPITREDFEKLTSDLNVLT